MPAAAYVWVGATSVEVPPSPNSHSWETIVPSVSVEALAVSYTHLTLPTICSV